jgi:thiamine biosynthesis lipoprotein ApbE
MAGTTVICANATEADAMSTTMFVLGPDGSRDVLRKVPCHTLFVPDERPLRILVTPGFRVRFAPAPEFAGCVEELAL